MPRLARLTVYPIKSLDPLSVPASRVLPSGALEFDRRFALLDPKGHFVNAKRNERVHLVRSMYDASSRTFLLSRCGEAEHRRFHVDDERQSLETWLGEALGTPVGLVENRDAGFPDDTDAPGPTVVSTATLETVATWFDGMTLNEARLRFRANLEIDGVEPFWEDRLFTSPGGTVRFAVGEVHLEGTNPCARCVVPSRSLATGERLPEFQRGFVERRRESLPAWAERSRFDHFYRLAVNTRPSPGFAGGTLQVGDAVRILDAQSS